MRALVFKDSSARGSETARIRIRAACTHNRSQRKAALSTNRRKRREVKRLEIKETRSEVSSSRGPGIENEYVFPY